MQFLHKYSTGTQASLFLLICLLAMATGTRSHAQSLDQIGQGKAVQVNGGVNTSHVFYQRSDSIARRDPYNYFVAANLNFSLYGWSVPLSFTYSNQQSSFQQPFNQYGITPSYKWVTGHAGWSSMSFSPYTLGGHIFLGGGVELNPDSPWQFKGMYGRLIKAVPGDTIANVAPVYKRMGYGFMGGYHKGNDYLDLILFGAGDELNSVDPGYDTLAETPKENLVLSLKGGKQLFGRVVLSAEYAVSALTDDVREPDTAAVRENIFSNAGGLFTPKPGSAYYDAFKAGLNYQADRYTVGLAYERIDPGYATLGAYFFNNDLENITANLSTSLLGGKLVVGTNVGSQRNNLNDSELSSTRRWVGAANLAYAASDKLNTTLSYSNFTTFTNARLPFELINSVTQYDLLDTLNYRQISQNATLGMFYLLGNGEKQKQTLSMNLSAQNSADEQNGEAQGTGTTFLNANASWSLQLVPQQMGFTTAFNASRSEAAEIETLTFGPTAAINQSFLKKKLKTTLSVSYNQTRSAGEVLNQVLNARINGAYVFKEKHNFNLSVVFLNRGVSGANQTPFSEYTTTFSYSYSF